MTGETAKLYTGDLSTPITPPDTRFSLLDDPATREAHADSERARIAAELERRYRLLMLHHGVPTDQGLLSMALLAIELARTHVPGLRVEAAPSVGRKQTWTSYEKLRLVADFVEQMAEGKTRAEAARALAKSSRYPTYAEKPEGLAKRFDEARKEPVVEALARIATNLPADDFVRTARALTENEK